MHEELEKIREPATSPTVTIVVSLVTFLSVIMIGSYIATGFFSVATSEKMLWTGAILGIIALLLAAKVFATLKRGSVTIYGLGVEREE